MRDQINCLKGFRLAKRSKGNASVLGWLENGVLSSEKHCFRASLSQRGYIGATSALQAGCSHAHLQDTQQSSRKMPWMVKLPFGVAGSIFAPNRCTIAASWRYKHSINNGPDLNRDFFVQLWFQDRNRRNTEAKRRKKVQQYTNADSQTSFNVSPGRLFSGGSDSYGKVKPGSRQPPTSQPVRGSLEPTSLEEVQLAPLLARSNLLITRDIEWANLTFGFEQENRYAIVDIYYPHSPVGYIREQSNLIMRQLLRSRRPFVAYITDALGNELFRVRRPFWWINSSIYTEVNGKEIGVVHRRWHLWRRIYDLYLGNEQFAVVENPGFWNWTFTLKDINGEVLAEIDRNWRGFGFELFTDAGQYAIRFGATNTSLHYGEDQELAVKYPLTLAQRAVAVALAISLDNDYFSRHGGWGIPFFVVGE